MLTDELPVPCSSENHYCADTAGASPAGLERRLVARGEKGDFRPDRNLTGMSMEFWDFSMAFQHQHSLNYPSDHDDDCKYDTDDREA